jgi:hypothetical protein
MSKKTYLVHYKLYGTVEVEAENENIARRAVEGDDGPVLVSDEDLLEGIYKLGIGSHPHYNISGDAIEVHDIEEVE